MVHGPCGELNPNSPCMENGRCQKHFPKDFRDHTTLGEDAYATYRRRDDHKEHTRNGKPVDNRWVVPYSPYFLWKYRCHINMECVISLKSIKYIYKYVYKGHDRTTMEFGRVQDEVQQYLDAHYVLACEVLWHIF